MNKKKEISNALIAFKVQIKGAVENLAAAARIYSDAVTKYGDDACRAFQREYPGVTQTTWDKMRLVAKGSLVPEAMMLSDRAAARVGYLPIEEQRKMLGGKKTLPVVTSTGRVVNKPLTRISSSEEAAIFSASGKVRSVEEQRRWYAARLADKADKAAYEIRGNFLIVHRATKFGKAELLDIVRKMK